MCGLSFYCCDSNPVEELQASLLAMEHRGPDASNLFYKKIENAFVGLGHNRLSILDLSEAGSQPMSMADTAVITYNGEVYNNNELRELLKSKGYSFIGHSDTEVVLKLYVEFGTDSFSMLKGMFAYALLDEQKKKLYVVRDRVGIKPVYIYQDKTSLYGSSEIRGLRAFSAVNPALDRNDIFEFFNVGFLYEPDTGYQYIKKLLPGHYLEYDVASSTGKMAPFGHIHSHSSARPLNEKIQSAVKTQLVSDVETGVFFSGGADSSILANYVDDQVLLFANYGEPQSENTDLHYSHKISDYLNKALQIEEINPDDQSVDSLLESIDFVAKNTEELISDYTFWPTYRLSLLAKNAGYKVMLSGMGGDEIFSGYPRYIVVKNHVGIKLVTSLFKFLFNFGLFPKKFDKKMERLVSYCSESHWPTAYSRLLGYFSREELKSFFKDFDSLDTQLKSKLDGIMEKYEGAHRNKVKLAQHFDMTGFLSHNLAVSDKASMLASIELRVPLLDETVVSHGLSLPSSKLLRGFQTKRPLKKLLAHLLPANLVKRPKTGFNPPLDGLIRKIGAERLKVEMTRVSKFINASSTDSMIEAHFAGQANNTYKLWQLLYFSRWLRANAIST